jgi:hypothetical protein
MAQDLCPNIGGRIHKLSSFPGKNAVGKPIKNQYFLTLNSITFPCGKQGFFDK